MEEVERRGYMVRDGRTKGQKKENNDAKVPYEFLLTVALSARKEGRRKEVLDESSTEGRKKWTDS